MLQKENIGKLQPTANRLLVERKKETTITTESGLILTPGLTHGAYKPHASGSDIMAEKPEEELDNLQEVVVVKAGPEAAINYKKGQIVYVNKYAGMDIFRDMTYYLINEGDIVATLK